MKVVHLISGGDIGGAKTHIETLLPQLNKSGKVEASLLCVIESALSEECRKMGVNVKIIPQAMRSDILSIKRMASWINEENFDIVHCHGARANFIALFLRLMVKKPFLTTIHSDYKEDFKGGGYKYWVYTPLNAFSLKRFTHFITIAEMYKKMLIERGFNGQRIDVISNGINFGYMPEFIDKKTFLENYGIEVAEKTTIIGCVTRLHPVKGVDILLKASKKLFKESGKPPDAIVLVAGSGDEKQNLLNYVNENDLTENVKFLGYIKDISSFYNAIDINVLPSTSEGLSLALIEGARFKLSTIASAVGGTPEAITSGDTGMLFESGDYSRLAELLLEEINNPQEGKQRGERFFQDASERFSVEKMAEKHIAVYNKLTSRL